MRRKDALTVVWVLAGGLVACGFSYYSGHAIGRKKVVTHNQEIVVMLDNYSDKATNLFAQGREKSLKFAQYEVNACLLRKIPPLVKRPWYVSLPKWLSDRESLDVMLNEALAELHDEE